jgi:hypothetical protein
VVRDWSTVSTWSWAPTIAGTYNVGCHVRDGKHAGATGWDDHKEYMGYSILRGPTVNLSPSSGPPGIAVTVTGSGFTLADTTCLISSSPSGLFSNSTCTVSSGVVSGSFTVASGVGSGAYSVAVTGSTGDTGSVVFTVTNVPPTISSLAPDKSSPQKVGTVIVWTCSATDPNGDSILYRFFVQSSGGSWSMVRDWSSSNTWAWTPSAAGTFNVACHVRDGKHAGATGWDGHKEVYGYVVKPNSPPVISSLSPDKASGTQVVGATITWTCSASDAENDTIVYRFWVRLSGGAWSMVRDWLPSNTWAWAPTASGTYDVACHVRDGKHAGVSGWDDHKEAYSYVITSGIPTASLSLGPGIVLGEQMLGLAITVYWSSIAFRSVADRIRTTLLASVQMPI